MPQTHAAVLTTALALVAGLSLAPLFGAASGGVIGYREKWAFQKADGADAFSTTAGYSNFHTSRPPASLNTTNASLDALSAPAGGVGTALGVWLAASGATAATLAVLALLGRTRGPALAPIAFFLSAGLLITLAVFYGIVGSRLAALAKAAGSLGSRPPILPYWGWITSLLSGLGWLLVPAAAKGLGTGPPGGLCGGRRGAGADAGAAGAATTKLADPEAPAVGPLGAGDSGKGASAVAAGAAAAAAAAAAGGAAAAARRDPAREPVASGGFLGRLLSRSREPTADPEAGGEAGPSSVAATAPPAAPPRAYSRSESAAAAKAAAHSIAAAALAKAGLPSPTAAEKKALAAVAAEGVDVQASVDEAVAAAAAAAAADLAAAKATAVELKRALTLELGPEERP